MDCVYGVQSSLAPCLVLGILPWLLALTGLKPQPLWPDGCRVRHPCMHACMHVGCGIGSELVSVWLGVTSSSHHCSGHQVCITGSRMVVQQGG